MWLMSISSIIRKLYSKSRNLILYGIIGCCSSGLDFLLYTLFVSVFGWHYVFSNSLSVIAGITTSFTLNRNYNFRVKDKTKQRFSIFLAVGLCGMLLSNLILWCCIDKMEMHKIVSKLLSIVLVVSFQFLFNKYITFKPTTKL